MDGLDRPGRSTTASTKSENALARAAANIEVDERSLTIVKPWERGPERRDPVSDPAVARLQLLFDVEHTLDRVRKHSPSPSLRILRGLLPYSFTAGCRKRRRSLVSGHTHREASIRRNKRQAVSVLPALASLKASRQVARRDEGTWPMVGSGDRAFDPAERRDAGRHDLASPSRGAAVTSGEAPASTGRSSPSIGRGCSTPPVNSRGCQKVGAATGDKTATRRKPS
jgi:hypothetical protein